MRQRRLPTWFLAFVVSAYAALIAGLWLSVDLLTDRVWLATLVAFGPRWLAAVPLVPLLLAVISRGQRSRGRLVGILAITAVVLTFGLMDYRLGLGRSAGPATLRIMTLNLGGANFSSASLDQLLKSEAIDVAALQECPYYDHSPAKLGWQFYYAGNFCLVSRIPIADVDVQDPQNAWRRNNDESMRFLVDSPVGRIQLLNLHLGTIRTGLEALGGGGIGGLQRFASNRTQARLDSGTARERARGGREPLIVAGDFNLPVESDIYRTDWADLRNAFSACGRGFGHTKTTRLHGVRIDHVLMSRHWVCTDARVLAQPFGGDHAALVVGLRLR